MKKLVFVAMVAVLLFGAETVSARADTYQYTFTPTVGTQSFSFQTNGAPISYGSDEFTVLGERTFVDGEGIFGPSFITFYNSGGSGEILDLTTPFSSPTYDFDGHAGPEISTGTLSSPTLLTGSFLEAFSVDVDDAPEHSTVTGILTVTVTPEPSTLMLLGTGLLGFAGLMNRRFFNC